MTSVRQEVMKVIDAERKYQEEKWGGEDHDELHSEGDWMLFIEHHLNKAKAYYSTGNGEAARDEMRKVATLGIAYGEALGLKPRE